MPEARAEVLALLLTDVVQSTRLAEQLGGQRTAQVWFEHNRIARDLLRRHDGREIDKTDGFLLIFERAADALAYAADYHRALAGLDPPMAARAGLHVGEVYLIRNRPEDVALGAKPIEVEGVAKPLAARVMSLAEGGQTVLTAAAVDATGVGESVRSLGHWQLKGVDAPVELFALSGREPPDREKAYRVVRDLHGHWQPLRSVRNSLPAERDRFVGRERELREVSELLDRARLVTILGLGGAGKTRLSIRAGRRRLGLHPGGVWFCDLAEARDVEGVARAVGAGLGVQLVGDDLVGQLGHAIAGRGACLVVLDNFEQVADRAFETLGRWLDRAADATFLVTSRERLGVPGEHLYPMPELAPEQATQLFSIRAEQVRPGFRITDADRADVEALVDLLDGLPLAIELAAARVSSVTPAQLLERMSARFEVLSGPRGRHPRHATLRATLEWSWDLLDADLRSALARLSVFEGGFTGEAAAHVLERDASRAAEALQGLVDRSLVRRVGEDRFDLLASVHAFAAEKLVEPGPVQRLHAAWFANRQDPGERGVELDNLAAAVRRSTAAGEGSVAVRALGGLLRAIERRGPATLGVTLARSVLPVTEGADRLAAHRTLGSALKAAAQHDEAREHYQIAIDGFRELGRRDELALSLSGLAGVDQYQARPEEARRGYLEALDLHRELGDRESEGVALCGLGNVEITHGDSEGSLAWFERSLEIQREIGDEPRLAVTLVNYAASLKALGRLAESTEMNSRALALHRKLGNRKFESFALSNIGTNLLHQGELDEAREALEEALAIAREVGARRQEGTARILLANLLLQRGAFDEAAEHMEDALVLHRELGAKAAEGILLGNLGNMRQRQGRLQDAEQLLTQALAIHREAKFRRGEAHWCAGLARLAAKRTEAERALEWAERALERAEPYPNVLSEAWLARAEAHLAGGDVDAAEAAVQAAADIGWGGEMAALVAGMRGLIAALRGDRAAADAAIAEATSDPQFDAPGTELAELIERIRAASS